MCDEIASRSIFVANILEMSKTASSEERKAEWNRRADGKTKEEAQQNRPDKEAASSKTYKRESASPAERFYGAVGVAGIGQDGSTSDGQGRDMGQCV